jgi:hypothetical protein
MKTFQALALIAAVALADVGLAAETDIENQSFRDLPLQRGPVVGGKRHQPTREEIEERSRISSSQQPPAEPTRPAAESRDDLTKRILQQSQKPTPRTLDPNQ